MKWLSFSSVTFLGLFGEFGIELALPEFGIKLLFLFEFARLDDDAAAERFRLKLELELTVVKTAAEGEKLTF